MSFQKNQLPPWQKNVVSNVIPTNFQQQMSIQQLQNQQQLNIMLNNSAFQQQQQQYQSFHNPAIIYPTNNRVNPIAFQQHQQQQPQQVPQQQQTNQVSQQPSSSSSSSKYNANLKTFSGTGLVSKVSIR